MKHLFLVDESLSPELAKRLVQLGYSAKHAREVQLKGSDDIKIVEWADKEQSYYYSRRLGFWRAVALAPQGQTRRHCAENKIV